MNSAGSRRSPSTPVGVPEASGRLNAWDTALIARYRAFYLSLDSGARVPTTPAQAHFVGVCRGEAGPRTQHEIAWMRWQAIAREGRDGEDRAIGRAYDGAPHSVPTVAQIEAIDSVEDAAIELEPGSPSAAALARIVRHYRTGQAWTRNNASEAAIWATTLLGDGQLTIGVERWSASTFNTLSTIYTRAMDGSYLAGLKGEANTGGDQASGWLHRLFEGHDPVAAWRAVCDALPDDSLGEELIGYLHALASDMSSVVGLPVTTLSRDSYAALASLATDLGLPQRWLIDALHYNAVEVISMSCCRFRGHRV